MVRNEDNFRDYILETFMHQTEFEEYLKKYKE